MAALFTIFGLSTFFLPLIRTVPPVMGNTDWSIFEILQDYGWTALLDHAASFLFLAILIYTLLLIAFFATFLLPSERLFGNLGLAGLLVTYLAWRFVRIDLERMLYGSIQDFRIPRLGIFVTGRGVGLNTLMAILGGVMLLLIFISRNRTLEGEQQ